MLKPTGYCENGKCKDENGRLSTDATFLKISNVYAYSNPSRTKTYKTGTLRAECQCDICGHIREEIYELKDSYRLI